MGKIVRSSHGGCGKCRVHLSCDQEGAGKKC